MLVKPIPAVLGFRVIDTAGQTNVLHFSRHGELVSSSRGLVLVPENEQKMLAKILEKWRDEDSKYIASQTLPYRYRIGNADDGGTLSGIARLFYGDASKWHEIYEENMSLINDPDIIQNGTVIMIPKLKD